MLAFSYTPGEVEDSRLLEDHRRWHPGSQHLGSRRQGTSSLPEGTHTLAEAASIPVRAPCTPAPAPGSKQQYRRNIDWRAVPPPLASVAAAAVVVVVVGTAGHQGSTWARNREVEEHSWPVAVVVAVFRNGHPFQAVPRQCITHSAPCRTVMPITPRHRPDKFIIKTAFNIFIASLEHNK